MTFALPPTEHPDPATFGIDELNDAALTHTLIQAQHGAFEAVLAAGDQLTLATSAVVEAIATGGHVKLFGAGSSGRLAVLDAAELPPTFGVAADLVSATLAGGELAFRAAVEGAEDDADAGAAAGARCRLGDVAIGISASGGASFVYAALVAAAARGATTVAMVNAPGTPLGELAQISIVLATGAEPIAGSTRLKAGTAQKIALNTISTCAMIRLGKTYGNKMVDVVATNAKLRARALRLVRELAGDVDGPGLLAASGGSVKTAVVMARLQCDRATAEAALAGAGGRLATLIGPAVALDRAAEPESKCCPR